MKASLPVHLWCDCERGAIRADHVEGFGSGGGGCRVDGAVVAGAVVCATTAYFYATLQ